MKQVFGIFTSLVTTRLIFNMAQMTREGLYPYLAGLDFSKKEALVTWMNTVPDQELSSSPMSRPVSLSIVYMLCFHLGWAQEKSDYVWVGGCCNSDKGNRLTYQFEFGPQHFKIHPTTHAQGFDSQTAIVSDKEGKLLFSCNGRSVFNKTSAIMPNGGDINAGDWVDIIWAGPEYGHPGFQDILILDDPATATGYYMIHKTWRYYPAKEDSLELRYSYIDMTADGSLGDVVYKNRYFYTKSDLLYAYLTAVRHDNGRDWWLLQPGIGRSIKTFLVDGQGIRLFSNQDSKVAFTREKSSAGGTARFSPDGRQYALYNETDGLLIYDFDRSSGVLTFDQKIVPMDTNDQPYFCSVEWSPNGRFLYTATGGIYLHQIDTWETDPSKAVTLIDTYNGTLDPFNTDFFLMVLGPDCRIYMTPKNGSYSIHLIQEPNQKGKDCRFVQNAIKMPNTNGIPHANGGSLPNFPRYRVDEADKCDPTISSIFGELVYYRRDLHVYPSPAVDMIFIDPPENIGAGTLYIRDIYGQPIRTYIVAQDLMPETIDVSSLPAATYHIEFYPDNHAERIFYSRQIVKVE